MFSRLRSTPYIIPVVFFATSFITSILGFYGLEITAWYGTFGMFWAVTLLLCAMVSFGIEYTRRNK